MTKEDFLKAKEDYVGLLMQGSSTKLNLYIEGKDDYNFYYQFFKDFKPNMIKCYRKSNVLKVAQIHERIGEFKCIFFVDKDFDNNEDNINIFVTDFYNFESHIFSRDNISNYLKSKHSISEKDIDELIFFLNSEPVLKIFHSEYDRIKLHEGISDNKLIDNKLNILDIDEYYNFENNILFPKGFSPELESEFLSQIEMYNGKHIGNLVFSIFKNSFFKNKFDSDMRVNDRKQLHNDMVIHCEIPEYINRSISYLKTI